MIWTSMDLVNALPPTMTCWVSVRSSMSPTEAMLDAEILPSEENECPVGRSPV